MRFVDLFSGMGGFSWALAAAGMSGVYASDYDPHCAAIYRYNFDTPFALRDIRATAGDTGNVVDDVRGLDFEVLTAGFPCQSFSRAGLREGFADPLGRGQLFFDLCRVIEAARPPVIFLENVANLQRLDGGLVFGRMLEELSTLGYFVKFAVLDAAAYSGLPQHRERLYVVGFLDQNKFERFHFSLPVSPPVPWRQLLEPPEMVTDEYYLPGTPLWHRLGLVDWDQETIYLWRRSHLRRFSAGRFPTLMASMGRGGHNVPIIVDRRGPRKLTPRECARLQGFPEALRFPPDMAKKHLYYMIGNSISVPTVTKIAQAIGEVFELGGQK